MYTVHMYCTGMKNKIRLEINFDFGMAGVLNYVWAIQIDIFSVESLSKWIINYLNSINLCFQIMYLRIFLLSGKELMQYIALFFPRHIKRFKAQG